MEDFYTHIDDYMNGLLEGEALQQFETELSKNTSLKQAVENYDAAKGISEGLLEVDMMETLKGLKEGYESKKRGGVNTGTSEQANKSNNSRGKIRNLRRWIAAASFIGVILFAGWWGMDWNEERAFRDELIAEVLWPEDEDGTKSVDTIGMNNFEKGKHYFGLNEFEESLKYLERYVSDETDEKLLSEGYEWMGACYLKTHKWKKAIKSLEKSNEESAIENLILLKAKTKKKG